MITAWRSLMGGILAIAISLSAAFDPAHAPFSGMERTLSRKLAARGLSVGILRVMDKPAELKPVGKR